MANGPELLLKPTHGLSEERRGFLRESAALLVQLRAQPAKRASSVRQLLPIAVNALHESKQPLLRRSPAVPLGPGAALFSEPMRWLEEQFRPLAMKRIHEKSRFISSPPFR